MRKILMMAVTAIVLMGTAVTTKAVSLLKSDDASIKQNKDNNLVLKHASELFGDVHYNLNGHGSHSSHVSHSSHNSHSSHYSSSS
jgi:hypothetical protein